MNLEEAELEVTRSNNKIVEIKVIMPTWARKDNSGKFYIKMPLLGGIETFCDNELEIQEAVEEAIKGFVLVAEKYGEGLELELKSIGWSLDPLMEIENDNSKSHLQLIPQNDVFNSMLTTGNTSSYNLQLQY